MNLPFLVKPETVRRNANWLLRELGIRTRVGRRAGRLNSLHTVLQRAFSCEVLTSSTLVHGRINEPGRDSGHCLADRALAIVLRSPIFACDSLLWRTA